MTFENCTFIGMDEAPAMHPVERAKPIKPDSVIRNQTFYVEGTLYNGATLKRIVPTGSQNKWWRYWADEE